MAHPVILASTSAYKKMLLERLKIPFTTVAPNTIEQAKPNETPIELASRLAKDKALAVLALHPDAVIIGSDQVGEVKGDILSKPHTFDLSLIHI